MPRPARRDRRRAPRRARSRSPWSTVSGSITGGHRFLFSTASSLPSVLASVSSRCTLRSASASGCARGVERLRGRGYARPRARRLFRLRRAPPARRRAPRRGRRDRARRCRSRQVRRRYWPSSASQPRGALLVLAQRAPQLVAPRGEIGERGGQFGERSFPLRRAPHRRRATRSSTPVTPLGARRRFGLERVLFARRAAPAPLRRRRRACARARGRRRIGRAGGRARRCAPWRALPRARGSRGRAISRCSAAAALASASRSAGRLAATSAWRVDGLRLLAGALGDLAHCLVLGAARLRSTSAGRASQRRWNSSASVAAHLCRKCCGSAPPAAPASSATRPGRRAGR